MRYRCSGITLPKDLMQRRPRFRPQEIIGKSFNEKIAELKAIIRELSPTKSQCTVERHGDQSSAQARIAIGQRALADTRS
jgi:hypothetical protein